MTTSCPLGGCPASRDLAAEVVRLRKEVADLRRSRDERKATERARADREAFAATMQGELDKANAEVERLRAGIEALTGSYHTPDCVKERETANAGETFWHPDCGRCWEDSLHILLNPTEGDRDD